MTNVIAIIFSILLVLMTLGGFLYWKIARSLFYEEGPKNDLRHEVKEGDVGFVHGYKNDWSGSPWWGRPKRGGLLGGFSPVVFTVLFSLVLFLVPRGTGDYVYDWFMVIDLCLYFTWVCYRQNRQALKMAQHLSKDSVKEKALYQKAFKYWPTRVARWIAPWLGVFYYFRFKKVIASLPENHCLTCGEPMEKDDSFQLSEAHECETKLDALRFEPCRCSHGHVYVVVEKGEQYDAFSTCPNCHAYALKNVNTEIVKEASRWHSGTKELTSVCQHCDRTVIDTIEYERNK